MSRLTRNGTSKTVSRDQILRRERGQGNINFPCSADHEQDWQPYPVDPYSCYMCTHTSTKILQLLQLLLLYYQDTKPNMPCTIKASNIAELYDVCD